MVTFTVDSDQVARRRRTHATIRYRNLVGQRYVALDRRRRRRRAAEERTASSRCERTPPALDLSVLFNGFKPLFTALTPGT